MLKRSLHYRDTYTIEKLKGKLMFLSKFEALRQSHCEVFFLFSTRVGSMANLNGWPPSLSQSHHLNQGLAFLKARSFIHSF